MRKFTVLEGLDLRNIEKKDLYKGVFNMVQVDLQIEMKKCKESPSICSVQSYYLSVQM